jgi:hypothetical protein
MDAADSFLPRYHESVGVGKNLSGGSARSSGC